jgi:hypothetical protein
MITAELLRTEIEEERKGRQGLPAEGLLELIRQGNVAQAIDELLFFTPPKEFRSVAGELEQGLLTRFDSASASEHSWRLEFVTDLATRLASFVPRWSLMDTARHGRSALSREELRAWDRRAADLAVRVAADQPEAERQLLADRRAEAAVRFKAEAVSDAAAAARAWVGESLADHLAAFRKGVEGSNLRRIAELRAEGKTRSEISNDYAAFLPYALHLGASFVTCNPPLVDIAWQADPPRWNAVADRLLDADPTASGDDLARQMTLEVVLSNMHLLRPIFLLTSGQTGCVSLQVNPKRHDDADSMIRDATSIYQELRRRLNGGVPNVVFKLPATRAGLQACRALTAEAIGVNITVNFALFQHLRFADEIQRGQAIFSVLSHMSGRLAFPVRDEMLGKLSELARHGIEEAQARLAAAWSGIIVLKRLHQLLLARGYDLTRVKPLIASMRVYEGEMYRGLPSPIPDISEVVGTGILTVFPNVRRAYDSLPGLSIGPRQIEASAPEQVLPILAHSEIFRQAYYVNDPGWGEDGDRMKPERVLRLEDEAATADWLPVRNTLSEFCKAYDQFVERIEGRRRLLELQRKGISSAAWTPAEETRLAQALTHFDVSTVRETLQWLSSIQPSPAVGAALRTAEVCQAFQSRGDAGLEAMRTQTLAWHSSQPLR